MIVWFFICFFQLNDTKRKNKRRHIQEILLFCFHLFFTLRIERNETMYNGSYLYFPFFVYELEKRKRKTNLPFYIFYYGFGKWKTKGRYIQHNVLFRFSFFHLAKEKNENMYNGSYFYFSFFVCGLRKKKRILRYPFPIFYYEIEKRKTKDGIYTDLAGRSNLHIPKQRRQQ